MYARGRILIPGTLAAGYQRGEEISDAVVESWGLTDAEVSADPLDVAATEVRIPSRPADDSDRAQWVAYAVARGTDPDEAAQTSLEDLMALYPEDEVDAGDVDRPADSARKSDWVDYVIAAGADEEWARSSDTIKADLQDWVPDTDAAPEQHTTDPAADQGNAALGA